MQSSILRADAAARKQRQPRQTRQHAALLSAPAAQAMPARVPTVTASPDVQHRPPPPLRKAFQIPMARSLARRHGYKAAATYLRKRGWSFEAAVWILLDASAAPAQIQPTLY